MVQVVTPFGEGAPSERPTGRAGTGDERLLAEPDLMDALYRAYARRLKALCVRRLGNEDDAEDAVHETLIKASRAWPSFRDGADPWPWLATIATNVCRDTGRRAARAAAVALDEEQSSDCFEAVARRARCELVQDALASLPRAYSTALYLRDIEGWSVPEIAVLRGRSIASVRSSLSRSRTMLAKKVEEIARARRQWPLPAAAPVIVRLRRRASRIKAAADDAALGVWMQLDAAFSVIGSLRVATLLQVAAALLAVTALTETAGRAVGGSNVAALEAAPALPASPAVGLSSGLGQPNDGANAPPPRGLLVTGPARVDDEGVTETPSVVASPPDSTPLASEDDVYIVVGPVGVDCSSAEREPGAWADVCTTLSQVPLPGSGR